MWEILKASTRPNVCIVMPAGPFDFTVSCDVTRDTVRQIIDKEKVCIIEFDDKRRAMSFCGTGKEIVSRLL